MGLNRGRRGVEKKKRRDREDLEIGKGGDREAAESREAAKRGHKKVGQEAKKRW